MPLTTESATRKDLRSGLGPMEHRHFAAIAAIIRDMDTVHTGTQGFIDIRSDVAAHFANRLHATNPKFDRARFLRACED